MVDAVPWHLATKRKMRADAAEQSVTTTVKESWAARYWYARRQRLRAPQHEVIGKPVEASGVSTNTRPGNDKFKEILLKKRRTYHRYFDRAVRNGDIDHRLQKVIVYRAARFNTQVQHQASDSDRRGNGADNGYRLSKPVINSTGMKVLAEVAKGVSRKWKKSVKKYTRCIVVRVKERTFRRFNHLLSWEERRAKQDKRKAELDWANKLEERNKLYLRLGDEGFSRYLKAYDRARKHLPLYYYDSRGRRSEIAPDLDPRALLGASF